MKTINSKLLNNIPVAVPWDYPEYQLVFVDDKDQIVTNRKQNPAAELKLIVKYSIKLGDYHGSWYTVLGRAYTSDTAEIVDT